MEKTASVFLLDLHTLQLWIRRLDEHGEHELVQTPEPVNRHPGFIRHLVRRLKRLFPALGSERIAAILAHAGLVLSATTVRRMIREPYEPTRETPSAVAIPRRAVARRPGDVWHVDLTAVPTRAGFWVPWLPFSLPQRWPFCWSVAAVVDQMSRGLVGFAVFRTLPSSERNASRARPRHRETRIRPPRHRHRHGVTVQVPVLSPLVSSARCSAEVRIPRPAREHRHRRAVHPIVEARVLSHNSPSFR
jgi:hypothetical protein